MEKNHSDLLHPDVAYRFSGTPFMVAAAAIDIGFLEPPAVCGGTGGIVSNLFGLFQTRQKVDCVMPRLTTNGDDRTSIFMVHGIEPFVEQCPPSTATGPITGFQFTEIDP